MRKIKYNVGIKAQNFLFLEKRHLQLTGDRLVNEPHGHKLGMFMLVHLTLSYQTIDWIIKHQGFLVRVRLWSFVNSINQQFTNANEHKESTNLKILEVTPIKSKIMGDILVS